MVDSECKHLASKYFPFSEFGSLFLGDFAKLRIATISFVMSLRSSVCRHGTSRLTPDRFSRNLIFKYFSKKCRENFKFHSTMTRIAGTLHEDQYKFLIISHSVRLRKRYVSEKSCSGTLNTHFVVE